MPGITTDYTLVGYTGPSTGSNFVSYGTGATGPGYSITPLSSQVNIDRTNNLLTIQSPAITTGSVQKVLTLQPLVPTARMNSKGVYGYFYGFVPGINKTINQGDAHLIHYQLANTGPTGAPIESYSQYKLTNPERFNSMYTNGDAGVQIACLMTNLTDFSPVNIYNNNNYNFYLLSSGSTGPRVNYSYQNGYFDGVVPQNIFTPFTGPYTGSNAFYCESNSGPYAILFSNQQCFVNTNGTAYSFIAGANGGKFLKYNSILSLISFSSTSINLYEIGPSAIVNTVSVNTGQSITHAATSYYTSPTNYRVYYIDSGRLYLATNSNVVQLGYFGSVTDMQVKYGTLYILVNNASASSYLYSAYDAGQPTTFNQVVVNTVNPSNAVMDIFQQTALDPIYIGTVSGNKYQVFNTTGQEVYRFQQGTTGSTGPTVNSIYLSFDLGDATIDMKYPYGYGLTGSQPPTGSIIISQ